MVNSTNEKSLSLDLHSIISIKAINIIDEVRLSLLSHFGTFVVEDNIKNEKADIVLSHFESSKKVNLKTYDTGDIEQFWIKLYKDEIFIVFGYRGKPDIAFSLSDPIRLLYTARPRCSGKLFRILILCIQIVLNRKKGMLCHGAVLCKENNSILLTGPSKAGKSFFVLNMLNEGWNYLSDDKFILYNKKAYSFRPYIKLNDYHYQMFPWLIKENSRDKKIMRWAWLRKRFRHFAATHLPSYLLLPFEKLYNPSFRKDPKDIFPSVEIIKNAEPNVWIALASGYAFSFTEVNKSEIVQDISAIQLLDFSEFEKLGQLLKLYGYRSHFEVNELIERNLKNEQKFYRMTVPFNADLQQLHQNFKECLKQVL